MKIFRAVLLFALSGCATPKPSITPESLQKSLGGSGVCMTSVEPARSYQIEISKIVLSFAVPDPNNTKVSNEFIHCDGQDGAIEDLCGVASHMNSVGYIDTAYQFYIRFDSREGTHNDPQVALGAKAQAICRSKGMP